MPVDSENPITPATLASGTLYLIDKTTGEETPLGPVKAISTVEAAPENNEVVHRINTGEEASFTFNIQFHKMNRKRFVKKLMAVGVSRNDANSVAEIARKNGHSYSWCYLVIYFTGLLPFKDSVGLVPEGV